MDKHTEDLLSQILASTNKITSVLEEHDRRLQNIEKIELAHNKLFQDIRNDILEMDFKNSKKFQRLEDLSIEHGKQLQKLENASIEHGKRLQKLESASVEHGKRLQKLESASVEHDKKLQSIGNIVTIIETDHGEKLQVLFDYFTTDSNRFQDLKQELYEINTILDKHDNRIYHLEFKKIN